MVKEIGALARPDEIRFTDALPEDALGEDHAPPAAGDRDQRRGRGDVTTLEDMGVIDRLAAARDDEE